MAGASTHAATRCVPCSRQSRQPTFVADGDKVNHLVMLIYQQNILNQILEDGHRRLGKGMDISEWYQRTPILHTLITQLSYQVHSGTIYLGNYMEIGNCMEFQRMFCLARIVSKVVCMNHIHGSSLIKDGILTQRMEVEERHAFSF